MLLRPVNDTLVLKVDEDKWVGDEKAVNVLNRGLILAPEHNTMRKKSDTGTIISWGRGCLDRYQVGQRVMFRRPSIPVLVNGEEYRIVIESQLLARYEND